MAQNVTLMGASYSDVPAVQLPKTGGGTAQFDDTSDANATAADIISGKTAYVNGVKLTGTGSGGGGGASNIVTGSFTGTTTGAAMDVNIPYTGSGYPVAVYVYVKGGVYDPNNAYNPTWHNMVQRYAVGAWVAIKNQMNQAPTYSSTLDRNHCLVMTQYKSHSTSPTSYSQTANSNQNVMYGSDATSSALYVIRFKSATKMSAYIADTSYGFAANIEYTYMIVYSS